ncbi:hypothetical protein KR222_011060 [Zaprionus bogoriensis]|nr:hypothetical protein KR222_011060 [Zaprionus bogoriensis]
MELEAGDIMYRPTLNSFVERLEECATLDEFDEHYVKLEIGICVKKSAHMEILQKLSALDFELLSKLGFGDHNLKRAVQITEIIDENQKNILCGDMGNEVEEENVQQIYDMNQFLDQMIQFIRVLDLDFAENSTEMPAIYQRSPKFIEKRKQCRLLFNHMNTMLMKGLQALYVYSPEDKIHLVFLEEQTECKPQIVAIRDVILSRGHKYDLTALPSAMDLIHLKIMKANRDSMNRNAMPLLMNRKDHSSCIEGSSPRRKVFKRKPSPVFLSRKDLIVSPIIFIVTGIPILYIMYKVYTMPKIPLKIPTFWESLWFKILKIFFRLAPSFRHPV